ncbi:MAG: polyphosphate kinase 2 family protein [Defluviicoccus sp.]|nr:MAG: polyphosphate kinase 2 family protein [Defluviicoccus sp.]
MVFAASSLSKRIRICEEFCTPYRITDGSKFKLKDINPGDTGDLEAEDKPKAKELLSLGVETLAELQERLYADDSWALLMVLQAMDAAGKDGTIKHVMSGVNPQGCQVSSFKVPSAEELDHDYLWRYVQRLPERGRIGIFNRSYYEEVLVVRVHKDVLARAKIPPTLVDTSIWEERYETFRGFEHHLSRNGYVICKFFLHLSKKEQKKRFMARLDTPSKNWKFSTADIKERDYWDDYQHAYEEMIRATAATHAPWFVVPADNKWYSRLVVASALIAALGALDLKFPEIDDAKKAELAAARAALEKE